jgi:hypothetical protein
MSAKEELIDRIANGEAELLDIGEICKRLKISRSTLERVRETPSNPKKKTIQFPEPDLWFGKSPRWEIQTFKKWLAESIAVQQSN